MAVVDLIIKLKDNASTGIGRIAGALGGLGGRAKESASGTQDLAGALTAGILRADAITFAIGKATQAIGFLNSKFEEAKNLQLEQINAATTFAALTGQSSEDAARFVENLNSRLAKSAATLPGATQDYKNLAIAIQDNVLEAFKDPAGVLNQKGFEDSLASISESFGALTAASTKDIGNTSLAMSKALSGASLSELRSYAFFEQNPVILNELEKQLKARGADTLAALSLTDRVNLLQATGAKFITEDFKRQAAESADGLLQSFTSYLFDPSEGLFGLMKDLDPATDGAQSAFSSMNDALKEVIGADGIFFGIAEVLGAAGVQLPHPMMLLKQSVDFFVGGLKRINEAIAFSKDYLSTGGNFVDAMKLAASFLDFDLGGFSPTGLSDRISSFFTTFGDRLSSFISGAGEILVPMFNQGVGIISNFFSDPGRFYSIGVAFGAMIGKAIGSLVVFLGKLDTGAMLIGIGRIAIAAIFGVVGAIGGLILGFVPFWLQEAGNEAKRLGDAIGTVILAIGQTFLDGLSLALNIMTAPVRRIPVIGQMVGGTIDAIIGGLQSLLTGGFTGLFTYVTDLFRNLITAGQTLISDLANKARNAPVIGAVVSQFVPELPQTGGGFDERIRETARNVPAIAPSYSGHIGWAANGFFSNLLGAAQQEMRRMPAGADLLVANSSETIIPQGMMPVASPTVVQPLQAAIAPPAPAGGSGGNTMIFNIYESTNVRATAEAVWSVIQQNLGEEVSAQMIG